MRKSHPLNVLEDLLVDPASRLKRKGVRLKSVDSKTVLSVYRHWIILQCDLGFLSSDSHPSIIRNIWRDITSRDIYDVLGAMDACVGLLRRRNSRGFKAHVSEISPHYYGVIKESSLSWFLTGSVSDMKNLLQSFSYCSRISLKKIDLKDQCIGEYLETESRISTRDYPFLDTVRSKIERWCQDFREEDVVFKHGPGGVAFIKKATLGDKYANLKRDSLIDSVYGHRYYTGHCPVQYDLDRCSQTIFVPKSWKTFRTISMEPPTLMYLQQGVWNAIDSMVKRNPYLRSRIDFHDQTRNTTLARLGSIDCSYSTIDLSAASDSVSYELVAALFGNTSLFPHIVATRSYHTVLPNGERIELKKFAPMGSALCFPIETMIFAAIAETSVERVSRLRGHGVPSTYSVFGDDIIVPSACSNDLIWLLESYGFLVNTSKSFYDDNTSFRESCGGEFVDGIDVTPLRISRWYSTSYDNAACVGLVDMINSCFHKGFTLLRASYLRELRSVTFLENETEKGYIPFFGQSGIESFDDTNYHTQTRTSRLFYRQVFATAVLAEVEPGDGEMGLQHWFRRTVDRGSTPGSLSFAHDRITTVEAIDGSVGKSSVQLQNRWVTLPSERNPEWR